MTYDMHMDMPEKKPEITLRDYFAAAALTGILAGDPAVNPQDAVVMAYDYADRMETERET